MHRRAVMDIAFIGLGRMGSAMVGRLIDAGHRVVLFNRTPEKALPLAERGGSRVAIASTPAEAARGAHALVTMLSDDAAVEAVLFGGHGAARTLPSGAVHVSASTISPACSERLERRHASLGQRYVAAPVLGRPEAAVRGELVVLAAGAHSAIEAASPIFYDIGRDTHVIGAEPAKANVVKLAANFVLAAMNEVFGEAYALAESHGVHDAILLRVLEETVFKSIAMYAEKIEAGAFDPPGFRLSLGAKDVRLAVETGERRTVPMPLASVLRDRFVAAMAEGFGDRDWSTIGRVSTARVAR